MTKTNISTAAKNIKKNFLLLFSTMVVLCLFFSPSVTSLVLAAIIFTAVMVAVALNITVPPMRPVRNEKIGVLLIATLIAYMGFDAFTTTWAPSSKAAALAGVLGTTTSMLLTIVGGIGCVVGFYAMYVLSCRIVSLSVKLMQEWLPTQDKYEVKANLRQNWYFPISAMAFFCLSITLTLGYMIGLLLAFIIAVLISTQTPSIWKMAESSRPVFKPLSVITAAGICFAGQESFYTSWMTSSKAQALEAILPIAIDIPKTVSVLGAVAAAPFVYFCVALFWNCIEKAWK